MKSRTLLRALFLFLVKLFHVTKAEIGLALNSEMQNFELRQFPGQGREQKPGRQQNKRNKNKK